MCSWHGFVLLGGLCSDCHTFRPRWYLQMFLHLCWFGRKSVSVVSHNAVRLTWPAISKGSGCIRSNINHSFVQFDQSFFCLKIGFKMVNNHIFWDFWDYKMCTTCWIKSATNCSIPMLETSILLHTAYCLKINERNYTILHSILIFHPEHNRSVLWDPEGAWRVSDSGCGVAQLHSLLGSWDLRLEFQELPEQWTVLQLLRRDLKPRSSTTSLITICRILEAAGESPLAFLRSLSPGSRHWSQQ